MADQRRRHWRRNALVLLGSLIAHIGAFYVGISEFQFYPQPPENQAPVEIEVVPPPPEMPPPPPPPIIVKQQVTPTPKPPSPPPQPTPQPPKPQPSPQPAPPQPAPQPAPTPTSPAPTVVKPTLTPAPKPAPAPTPTPLAPPAPAPQPGPPKAVPAATVVQPQTHTVSAPKLVLHRDRNQQNSPLSVNIPGAVFAPTPAPPSAGAPAGGASAPPGSGAPGGGFPGGALPGFGSGLRGGLLGCANADALHLSPEERARCAESFGSGTRESPQMNPIDASHRAELDHEAAAAAAAAQYKNSTPSGTESTPTPGQPRVLTGPNQ